jgi:hypothetical protein
VSGGYGTLTNSFRITVSGDENEVRSSDFTAKVALMSLFWCALLYCMDRNCAMSSRNVQQCQYDEGIVKLPDPVEYVNILG